METLENPSMNPLAMEIILKEVFTYLTPAHLKRCRLVSKQWEVQASARLRVRGTFRIPSGRTRTIKDFVNRFQPGETNFYPISKLSIGSVYDDTDKRPAVIQELINICRPNLAHLSMEFYPYPGSAQDLIFRKGPAGHILEALLPTLCSLILSNSDDVPTLNLKNLHYCFPNLKALTIKQYFDRPMLKEDGLPRQILGRSLALEELTLVQYNSTQPIAPPLYWPNLSQIVEMLNSFNLTNLRTVSFNLDSIQNYTADQLPFLPACNLRSIHVDGMQWNQLYKIWIQHQQTLESVTVDLSEPAADELNLDEAEVFPRVHDVTFNSKSGVLLFESIWKLFPPVTRLTLINPTAENLRFTWEHLVQLKELELIFETCSKYLNCKCSNVLHLDSVLSGKSITACEQELYLTDLGQIHVDDFYRRDKFGNVNSITNLTGLQKLVIRSEGEGGSCRFRITELSLISVLLKMKSLTSIEIYPILFSRGVYAKNLVAQIREQISPAVHLSFAQNRNSK